MANTFKIEDIFSVKGKTVVVTGGGSGLGKAIAAGFVTNGATVYITGRRFEVLEAASKEINEGQAGKSVPIKGDVSTKAGCLAIADALTKAGVTKVDTLVNCAGVVKPWRNPTTEHNDPDAVAKMMAEVEDEDFNYSNEINSNGVYFMTIAILPLLRAAESPNVTVIASIAGLANQRYAIIISTNLFHLTSDMVDVELQIPVDDMLISMTSDVRVDFAVSVGRASTMGSLTYGVSKAATIHCAELMAGRFQPMKIRVNTICPGIFPSEMTGVNSSSEREGHNYDMGDAANKAAARSTAGRPGKPEEIVGPVLLLSSRAGGYMNNALLTVDGGRLMGAGINDGVKMPEDSFA